MQLILCYKLASFLMQVLARTGEHLSLLKAVVCETLKSGYAASIIMDNRIMRLAHDE